MKSVLIDISGKRFNRLLVIRRTSNNRIRNKLTPMHKLILKTPFGKEIDHIDNNTLNNRRENLRVVLHSDNTKNVLKREGTSTEYIGVSFNKKTGKYVAYIDFNKKRFSFGCYPTPKEAAIVRDKKAISLSPYYKLNF